MIPPTSERIAQEKNLFTLDRWLEHLAQVSIASIEWDVPDTIDPIYLERELYYHGKVIFFAVEEGLVALSGFGTSMPNLYGIPVERTVRAKNGFTADLDQTNSVICYNNVTRTPGSVSALSYATRLAELDRIIQLNARAQKTPVVLKAPKEAQLTVENAYGSYDENAEVIRINNDYDPEAISVLNLGVPFQGNEIRSLQQSILEEFLRTRGIGSANAGKAERLNTSEVAAGNSGLLICQRAILLPRLQACDLANKRFENVLGGKKMGCHFARDMIDYILDDFQAGIDAKKMPVPGGYTYQERTVTEGAGEV